MAASGTMAAYHYGEDYAVRDKPRSDDWLTATDAAEETGYHRTHIYLLIREGQVVTRKASSGLLVYMPDLWAYIKETGRKPYGSRDDDESGES